MSQSELGENKVEVDIKTLCDLPQAKKLSKWADAVLIGPGLGKDPKTIEFFERWI